MSKSEIRAAIREAERFVKESFYEGVHTVYRGKKIKGGRDTGEEAVVFAVEKKRDVPAAQMLPPVFLVPPSDNPNGPKIVVTTDVVECPRFEIQDDSTPYDPKERHRPPPGGVSYGHFNITAGTLGGYVRRPADPDPDNRYVLTNAHVGSDINEAKFEDENLQPGPADGGTLPVDEFGLLFQRVHIHIGNDAPVGNPCEGNDGGDPGGGKKIKGLAWRAWKWPANRLARALDCPYRMIVLDMERHRYRFADAFDRSAVVVPREEHPFCLPQVWPNLADACLIGPISEALINPEIANIGLPVGLREADLGDAVIKQGRTTGFTMANIRGVDATSQVGYGGGSFGIFRDQLIIERDDGKLFSAGGDSGSWILDQNRMVVGLLFAGGGGVTIANRMTNVFSLLGVTL